MGTYLIYCMAKKSQQKMFGINFILIPNLNSSMIFLSFCPAVNASCGFVSLWLLH